MLFDFRRAYDTVWQRGLTEKLLLMGVAGCAVKWIEGFLQDRRARVKLGSATSPYRRFSDGLPQGAVLSPLLFSCFINDLPGALPRDCHPFLYADDLAVAVQARTVEHAVKRAQAAVDAVAKWATKWRMTLASDKCSATLFTTSPTEANIELDIKLHGEKLPTDRHPKFLGVVFDRLLSFTEHAKDVSKRAKTRCGILSALAGASWGPKWQDVRALYLTYVRPVMEYAGGAWMPCACDTAINHLEVAQRCAARAITGSTRDTNAAVLEREAHLVPMKFRAEQLAADLRERALRLPQDNPLRDTATDKCVRKRDGSLRLKSIRSWRESGEAVARTLDLDRWPRDQLKAAPLTAPWDVIDDAPGQISVNTELEEKTTRTDHPDLRRDAYLKTAQSLPDARTHVWTDGAAEEGVYNGGSGVLILQEGTDRMEVALPAGRHTSSYRAELVALDAALSICIQQDRPGPIRVSTDSLSALQTLQKGPICNPEPVVSSIWNSLCMMEAKGTDVVLQWVPGHAGVDGNEEVDAVAKRGCDEDQLLSPISLPAVRRYIHRHMLQLTEHAYAALFATSKTVRWHTEATGGKLPQPPPKDFTRAEQRIIHQMRSGNSPLCAEYLFRINKNTSPACPSCGTDSETVGHMLLECPAWTTARLRRWGPSPTAEEAFSDLTLLLGCLKVVQVGRATLEGHQDDR